MMQPGMMPGMMQPGLMQGGMGMQPGTGMGIGLQNPIQQQMYGNAWRNLVSRTLGRTVESADWSGRAMIINRLVWDIRLKHHGVLGISCVLAIGL